MTTASKLQALVDGLEATRQAIEGKGATLPAGSPLGDYPEAITNLPSGSGGGDTEIPFRSRLTVPGDTAPWHLTSLTATSLGIYAFYGDTFLTSVSLPSVTSLDLYAFYNCTSLTTADFPAATNIGNSAFRNCASLTSVSLPLVPIIGSSAFYGCRSLTSLTLPSVTSISGTAFRDCTSLTSLTLSNTNITNLSITNALQGTPIANGTGHIYVPDDLVDQYKTATNWSTYANQILPLSQKP